MNDNFCLSHKSLTMCSLDGKIHLKKLMKFHNIIYMKIKMCLNQVSLNYVKKSIEKKQDFLNLV